MNTQDEQLETQATRTRHWARRTHRVLGVSSALFLVLISLSGLVLNHADALGLARNAAGPWLLGLYGIELPPVDSAFEVDGILFATAAGTLYADGAELAKDAGHLTGAVAVANGLVVATGDEFFVASSNAALIERFAPNLNGPILKLGTDGTRVLVALADGYTEFDPLRMRLGVPESETLVEVHWSQPATPTEMQAEQVGTAALGQAINWERVLLDLHSGRILPGVGRYLADLTALALLYMCFSGIVLWTRKRT